MSWIFLLKGLAIGFAIAAPVGPIGVLCVRRTFADGHVAGFVTGLGAATADALYGAVAAFGLTAISDLVLGYQTELRLVGGLFLLALGVKTFLARVTTASPPMRGSGWLQSWATTVLLTLGNPATILSFAAVFAGAGLGQQVHGFADALAIVVGVFLGSATWWLLLSYFIDHWRDKHTDFTALAEGRIGAAVVTGAALGVASKTLKRINQGSGVLLAAFGVAAVVAAL